MATIASLLRERVTLQVNSVDRIFLAGYIPKLQSEGQVVRFLLDRGFPASCAARVQIQPRDEEVGLDSNRQLWTRAASRSVLRAVEGYSGMPRQRPRQLT